MMKQKLPNFFIVGAPKAGTTSLYHYLQKHPKVHMSTIKEPNYFSYEETLSQRLYHKEKGVQKFEDYKMLFAGANGAVAIGEASVSYLFYPQVPDKIHRLVPDARIIIILRNPVDRAYSHYFMEHKMGYVSESLESIVDKSSRHKYVHLYYQQYVELGLYYDQVKRYLDTFGQEHVRIFIYEEVMQNTTAFVNNVYQFLGLNGECPPEITGRYNTFSAPRNQFFRMLYSQKRLRKLAKRIVPTKEIEKIKKIFLSPTKKRNRHSDVEESMMEIFKPDIHRLEKLLNKNLALWYER